MNTSEKIDSSELTKRRSPRRQPCGVPLHASHVFVSREPKDGLSAVHKVPFVSTSLSNVPC